MWQAGEALVGEIFDSFADLATLYSEPFVSFTGTPYFDSSGASLIAYLALSPVSQVALLNITFSSTIIETLSSLGGEGVDLQPCMVEVRC